MNDILRTFRLGTINLVGVTIPGLMFLLLLLFGCIAPCLLAISYWMQVDISLTTLPPIGKVNLTLLSAVIVVVAYIAGYIFRLSTPDDLDKKSADIVLGRMKLAGDDAPAKDHWPYRGEPENKFPYFHFKDYLTHRKHPELAAEVKWSEQVRSKTFVNKMKFETAVRSPQLSAIIESNEAHIRLMFGTWLACRATFIFIVLGCVMSAVSLVIAGLRASAPTSHVDSRTTFLPWIVITLFLGLGNDQARRRIENLFHYRRVRELFDIVACYHLARTTSDASGRRADEDEN